MSRELRRQGLRLEIRHGHVAGLPADAITTDVITDRGGYSASVAAYVGEAEV